MEDLKELSPAILAYLGDAVYELAVRSYLVAELGIRKTKRLHQEAVKLVRAEAQARIAHLLEEELAPTRPSCCAGAEPPAMFGNADYLSLQYGLGEFNRLFVHPGENGTAEFPDQTGH